MLPFDFAPEGWSRHIPSKQFRHGFEAALELRRIDACESVPEQLSNLSRRLNHRDLSVRAPKINLGQTGCPTKR